LTQIYKIYYIILNVRVNRSIVYVMTIQCLQ